MATTAPATVFDGSSLGRVAVEAHVTAGLVVVGLVLQESPEEMSLAERNDVISTLATDRSDDSLDLGILPRRFPGADHLLDADRCELLFEHPAVDRIPVAVEILRLSAVAGKGLDDLLCGP